MNKLCCFIYSLILGIIFISYPVFSHAGKDHFFPPESSHEQIPPPNKVAIQEEESFSSSNFCQSLLDQDNDKDNISALIDTMKKLEILPTDQVHFLTPDQLFKTDHFFREASNYQSGVENSFFLKTWEKAGGAESSIRPVYDYDLIAFLSPFLKQSRHVILSLDSLVDMKRLREELQLSFPDKQIVVFDRGIARDEAADILRKYQNSQINIILTNSLSDFKSELDEYLASTELFVGIHQSLQQLSILHTFERLRAWSQMQKAQAVQSQIQLIAITDITINNIREILSALDTLIESYPKYRKDQGREEILKTLKYLSDQMWLKYLVRTRLSAEEKAAKQWLEYLQTIEKIRWPDSKTPLYQKVRRFRYRKEFIEALPHEIQDFVIKDNEKNASRHRESAEKTANDYDNFLDNIEKNNKPLKFPPRESTLYQRILMYKDQPEFTEKVSGRGLELLKNIRRHSKSSEEQLLRTRDELETYVQNQLMQGQPLKMTDLDYALYQRVLRLKRKKEFTRTLSSESRSFLAQMKVRSPSLLASMQRTAADFEKHLLEQERRGDGMSLPDWMSRNTRERALYQAIMRYRYSSEFLDMLMPRTRNLLERARKKGARP